MCVYIPRVVCYYERSMGNIRASVGWLVSRRGLLILLSILIWISVVSIHPTQYLIGWDNYSAYLGGFDGLFRTFFSTWRSYRGIGVAGDSESADVFRQLIILVISPFVSEPLRDQWYILGCLWIGVLSVYVLVSRFAHRLKSSEKFIDVVATIAAATYLFNLNTLATFYFPIITYITRFAALPLLLVVFDIFIRAKHVRWTTIALFTLANLFASGSYITGTVFITTAVLLGAFVWSQGVRKRGIVALGLFVVLQAYWLIPFANYTVQKSPSLRLAPVFVDTNEAQLNLKPQAYSPYNQFIVYPNFFETRFQKADAPNTNQAFHPITDALQNPLMQYVLLIFPLLAILGSICILLQRKRYRSLLWVPFIYFFYILMSSQEYSWFGFVPAFLNRYIPYFQVIFRFGDTKFHPYIILTGAVAAGIAIVEILHFVASRKKYLVMGVHVCLLLMCVALPASTVFKAYTTGDFLPQFLFVEIPNGYREVAKIINTSQKEGRVLHLPYDPSLYWRSYSWGYLGSAFFQDLLRVPYMDKTFEPASLKTTDFFTNISSIIQDASDASQEGQKMLADKLSKVLSDYGIRFIVMDSSVTPAVTAKNAAYWGEYNLQDSQTVIATLERIGSIKKVLDSAPLSLYEAQVVRPLISYGTPSMNVDTGLTHISTNAFPMPYTQAMNMSGFSVFPLLYKDAEVSKTDTGFLFSHDISSLASGHGVVKHRVVDAHRLIDVAITKNNGEAVVELRERHMPDMGGVVVGSVISRVPLSVANVKQLSDLSSDASEYRSNWHVLGFTVYSPLRVVVGDMVLPVPTIEKDGTYHIGTVLTSQKMIPFEILVRSEKSQVLSSGLRLTDNPSCFGDQGKGYTHSYNGATLTTEAGSTCLIAGLGDNESPYSEVKLTYESTSDDGQDGLGLRTSQKPSVRDELALLHKPAQLSVCIQDASFDTCANLHTITQLQKNGRFIIPSERRLYKGSDRFVRLALMTQGDQRVTLTVKNLEAQSFRPVHESVIDLGEQKEISSDIDVSEKTLKWTVPYVFSSGSFYTMKGKDGFGITNQSCATTDAYRTILSAEDSYISYLSNCYAEVSTNIPFTNDTMKLWTAAYTVYSGKYPKFILKDQVTSYVDSYLSFDQGYPDIAGNLSFESPEQWYMRYTPAFIRKQFAHSAATAYTMVSARSEIEDSRRKNYTIHQNSQNEGIFRLESQDIAELPQSWQTIHIDFGIPIQGYGGPANVVSKKLLPSLWRVDISGIRDKPLLLRLNEGFDHQWKAYPSMISMIFGFGKSIESVRCNGFANCYQIPTDGTYYLLYTPERLAVFGWLIVFLTIAACFITARAKE